MIKKIVYMLSNLSVLGTLLFIHPCLAESKVEGIKPNFVWLVSEDNSAEFLKIYNENGVSMPNIESLAKNGLIFDNAFSNAPVCSTARSTLATGVYGAKIGTQHHRPFKLANLQEGLKPISLLLKEQGYYTSNDQKNDFNFVEQQPAWNELKKHATWRNRKPNQPFFHMQSWTETHESSLHFPLSDIKNKPTINDPNKVVVAPIYPDTELFRYTYARYLDNHQKVDQQIGKVIDKLSEDGLLENTFIFYFGDHGGALPGSKGYAFERGLKVPLVIRIPENFKHLLHSDFQALNNYHVKGFVNFVDFAPTLLKLAGIKENKLHVGQPFLGNNVSLQKLEHRNVSYAFADRFDEKYDLVRTVRVGKYKYIRHYLPFNTDSLFNHYRYKQQAYKQLKEMFYAGKLTSQQAMFFQPKPVEALYNIDEDPYEVNNLAADTNYQSILQSLREKLTRQLKSLPDLGFYPEYWQNKLTMGEDNYAHIADIKSEVSQLIDISNLALQGYAQVKDELILALTSDKTWVRYWAINVALSFGDKAKSLLPDINKIAKYDINSINRARAIQFLALVDNINPVDALKSIVQNSSDTMAILAILNMATQLKESKGYSFNFPMRKAWSKPDNGFKDPHQETVNYWFKHRINYLK